MDLDVSKGSMPVDNEQIKISIDVDKNFTSLFDEDVDLRTVTTIDSTDDDSSTDCSQFSVENAEDVEVYHGDHDIAYMVPVPKNGTPKDVSLTPITIMVVRTIGTLDSKKLLRVLLDPGSTKTMIHRRALPRGTTAVTLEKGKTITTLAGLMNTSTMVRLRDIKLPEFDKNRIVEVQNALVFDQKCRYDVILGSDFLTKTGIDIQYSTRTMEWFENILPMRDPRSIDEEEFWTMADAFNVQLEEDFLGEDWLDSHFAAPIMDAKYEKLDIPELVKGLTHLTEEQQQDLKGLLEKHQKLFDGTLGVYPHRKFHIEIEPDAKPVHARPYAVPHVHLEVFKKELQHLVKLGVLSPQGISEWASPTFITPKKDGRVRWISDLRQLNKVVKRKQYPLPIISDVLKKRNGYSFFSKLDISMQYYTFELDEESKDLCTIVTPFGKFKYNRLPMGLKCSPDFAQEVMENIFRDMEDTDVYIDDIGAFSNDWKHHVALLDDVLGRLVNNGFTVNPLKCEWAVKETDWLGYWLTPEGLKPWKKKIDAILKMEPPKSVKQLRGFVGAVNYYRDMWPHRSHILAPLTAQTGKKDKKFIWSDEMQDAFDKMKALMAADAISAYPNHNLSFHIYTDASDFQLGAVIMQNGRPVAYYSRKLNKAQKNYTTMEKELLSIVATLKEFRSMLLGADLHIHTDHKNLTYDNLQTQRVLRWRVYLEEYSPQFHYIEGPKNTIADTFSRLHNGENDDLEGEEIEDSHFSDNEAYLTYIESRAIKSIIRLNRTPSEALVGKNADYNVNIVPNKEIETYYSLADDPELVECFLTLPDEECYLNFPTTDHEDSPLNFESIRQKQQADAELLEWK